MPSPVFCPRPALLLPCLYTLVTSGAHVFPEFAVFVPKISRATLRSVNAKINRGTKSFGAHRKGNKGVPKSGDLFSAGLPGGVEAAINPCFLLVRLQHSGVTPGFTESA